MVGGFEIYFFEYIIENLLIFFLFFKDKFIIGVEIMGIIMFDYKLVVILLIIVILLS